MVNVAPLADPTRQRIIELLAQKERSSGDIAEYFEMSASAVSQHLAVLKEAQFVQVRVEGQRRIYTLDAAGFTELKRWLAKIDNFWQTRLDKLEDALRTPQKKTAGRKKKGPKP